jgi:hypothetical protein
MSRQIALMVGLITILSLVMTPTTTAANDVVDLALQGIGPGSTAEMKSRIFSRAFSVYGSKDCPEALASLPQSVRESRISRGRLLGRVELVIRPVLELHGHRDEIELFLYRDHLPTAMVWMGCVLVISDALADHLSDNELAGIVAHEMAHAYFMSETIKARKHGDGQAMRIVELKCDAVAMLTLKLMGRDAADYPKALRRITDITRRDGYARINPSHPSIDERTEFAQRFIKLLT